MAQFQTLKPENVLKRTDEYIKVGRTESALKLIYEMLSNRRGRTWSQAHEQVMLRYINLCVKVQNSRYAKEGLHQFRSLALPATPGSLEKAISHLLSLSLKKVEEAAAQCATHEVASSLATDLDDPNSVQFTPDSLNVLDTKSRAERDLLQPWLRFMWENLRAVVELLRAQPKLDDLYHTTARKAFEFCGKYNRPVEFRRLCDILRNHLHPKHQRFDSAIINTPSTMSAHLETRFEQLRVASKLRIWHEGFKTIEDIHYIMAQSQVKSSSKLMGNYYEKLMELFMVSENYLFHAYAFRKFYTLSRDKKKSLTEDDLKLLASGVLLAALSIPLKSNRAGTTLTEQNTQKDKNRRLAQLLGFDGNPQRSAIIDELLQENILNYVCPEIRGLFVILEQTFAPLDLVEKITPLLKFIKDNEQLKGYEKPIEQLLVVRLVSHLSTIFQTVRLDYLKGLLKNLAMTDEEIEVTLIKAVKARQVGSLAVRIDHQMGCIRFGSNIIDTSQTQDILVNLYTNLKSAARSSKIESKLEIERDSLSIEDLAESVKHHAAKEHADLLARKDIIEKRKTDLEQRQVSEIKATEQQRFDLIQQREAAEKKRMQDQLARKQRDLLAKQENEARMLELKREMISVGVDVTKTDVAKLSEKEREKLINDTKQKQETEAMEAEKKKNTAAKRLDGYIRAKREIARPNVDKILDDLVQSSKEQFNKRSKQRMEAAKAEHEAFLHGKKRCFPKMEGAREVFEKPLLEKWNKLKVAEYKQRVERVRRQQCIAKLQRAKDKYLTKQRELKDKRQREEFEAKRIADIEAQRRTLRETDAHQPQEGSEESQPAPDRPWSRRAVAVQRPVEDEGPRGWSRGMQAKPTAPAPFQRALVQETPVPTSVPEADQRRPRFFNSKASTEAPVPKTGAPVVIPQVPAVDVRNVGPTSPPRSALNPWARGKIAQRSDEIASAVGGESGRPVLRNSALDGAGQEREKTSGGWARRAVAAKDRETGSASGGRAWGRRQ